MNDRTKEKRARCPHCWRRVPLCSDGSLQTHDVLKEKRGEKAQRCNMSRRKP